MGTVIGKTGKAERLKAWRDEVLAHPDLERRAARSELERIAGAGGRAGPPATHRPSAAASGAALALAGAALQGAFRNPLVGPQIIGVSSGAAFGGALAIFLGLGSIGLLLWHYHGHFAPPAGATLLVGCKEGGAVLHEDAVSTNERILA